MFTASDISADFAAASMMPAKTLAAGGKVGDGGAVATLQLVGAAGLGLTDPPAPCTLPRDVIINGLPNYHTVS